MDKPRVYLVSNAGVRLTQKLRRVWRGRMQNKRGGSKNRGHQQRKSGESQAGKKALVSAISIMALVVIPVLAWRIWVPKQALEQPGQGISTPGPQGGVESTESSATALPDDAVQKPEQPQAQESEGSGELAVGGAPESEESGDLEENLFFEPRLPMLVNPTHSIPEDFTPDIVPLGNGYELDRKAAQAWAEMTRGAAREGISLWVVSAYRSYERQWNNFYSRLEEYKKQGYSEEEAYSKTAAYIAVPGTSEHSLGYAVDLCSLEESFENTDAFRWLYRNCADYGFILRYPKDKEHITKINYEPWHYRYVGSNHAGVMMNQGLCLEEYLGVLE